MEHQSPGRYNSIIPSDKLCQSERGDSRRVPALRRDGRFGGTLELPLRLLAKVATLLAETIGNGREPPVGKAAVKPEIEIIMGCYLRMTRSKWLWPLAR